MEKHFAYEFSCQASWRQRPCKEIEGDWETLKLKSTEQRQYKILSMRSSRVGISTVLAIYLCHIPYIKFKYSSNDVDTKKVQVSNSHGL